MSANKSPSYPWYPRDFAADEPVQLMTLAEEGAYRRLLDHQWLHGSIPGDVAQLARICKNIKPGEMKKMWAVIGPCFHPLEGQPVRYQNRKLERVRTEREAYLAKQKASGAKGGKSRWDRARYSEPTSEPTGNPSSEPTSDPTSETIPGSLQFASASASASALQQPSVGLPGAERLASRFDKPEDRRAVWSLLGKVPESERAAWIGQLLGYLDGLDFPAGMCPAPSVLATACRDYAGTDKPSPIHFRAFVLRLVKQEQRPPRAADGPAGPRRGGERATGQAAIEAGLRWANQGGAHA